MQKFLARSAPMVALIIVLTSCARVTTLGPCSPLQIMGGDPVEVTCWVSAPLRPLRLVAPGILTEEENTNQDLDLVQVVELSHLSSREGSPIETSVAKLEFSCERSGAQSRCHWKLSSRPKDPLVTKVLGDELLQVVNSARANATESATARLAVWEKDREKGPRLLVVLKNWQIDYLIWSDDRDAGNLAGK